MSLAVTACVLLLIGVRTALLPVERWTGWSLFLALVFLTSYNLRKKLPLPYLLNSRTWLRAHIAVAIAALGVYVVHTGARIPNGLVEVALSILWLGTMLSGFFGLTITRSFPRRLTTRGGEAVFESIPIHIRQLKLSIESLVHESIATTGYSTVAYFYSDLYRDFFRAPANRARHIFGLDPPLDRVLHQIADKARYVNDQERRYLEAMGEHIRAKDALDFQYSLQWLLKTWLFTHIALTYATILVVILHIALVYTFGGVSL